MKLSDFEFDLPPELIAQTPAEKRSQSRLLVAKRHGGEFIDSTFANLGEYLSGDEVFVINDTKVLHARLFGQKDSGGKVELLALHESGPQRFVAMVNTSKPLKSGRFVTVSDEVTLTVIDKPEAGVYQFELPMGLDFFTLLKQYGQLPLPPYIERATGPTDRDEERYQTVFANKPGAVAAPTASLHFDTPLMQALKERGCEFVHVTLHVGPGTFMPVRSDDLDAHVMHSEYYEINEESAQKLNDFKQAGRPIFAVGTTVVRTLESACDEDGILQAEKRNTQLFIRPGYPFRFVDKLMTNFHLPGSTLLMLVSAFAGYEQTMALYQHAIQERYRFYSYGDSMVIL